MISHISIIALIVSIFLIVAFFLILKGFSLPASYFKNQAEREGILKNKIKTAEEQKEIILVREAENGNDTAAESNQK